MMARLLLVTTLMLCAGAVRADDSLFYIGAGISRNKLSDITNSGVSFSDIDHTAWKALVGVRPISVFAVEADYLDLGKDSNTFIVPGVGTCPVGDPNCATGSTHSDAKAFAGYAVGFLPLPVPFLDLYGKVGASRWKLNGSSVGPTARPSLFSFSESGTGFAWGAGAQVHVGNVGARLEYESFSIAHANGAQIISLDVILRL